MKKLAAILGVLFGLGAYVASLDSPMKSLEGFALQHSDKLPLAYLGEKLFDEHCATCHDNPDARAYS